MLITIDNLLTANEVKLFNNLLNQASWEHGAKTAGGIASRLKQNQQLADEDQTSIELANLILSKLGNHPKFISAAIPAKIHPPRFNRYASNEAYGVHVDAPIMSIPHSNQVLRSDVSVTVFLTDPKSYQGGELQIEGEFGSQSIKLQAGSVVVYPSSSLHQVTPVTKGIRTSAILWVQSMIADSAKRALLYDLDQSIQTLTNLGNVQTNELMKLSTVYHNLVRRWAQV